MCHKTWSGQSWTCTLHCCDCSPRGEPIIAETLAKPLTQADISLINPEVFPRGHTVGPEKKLILFKWEFGSWSSFVALKLLNLQKMSVCASSFQPLGRWAAVASRKTCGTCSIWDDASPKTILPKGNRCFSRICCHRKKKGGNSFKLKREKI